MMPLDFLRSLRWQPGLDVVLAARLLDQLVLSVREIRALRALRLGGTSGGLSHVYGHAYRYRSEMTSECFGGRWRNPPSRPWPARCATAGSLTSWAVAHASGLSRDQEERERLRHA